MIGLLFNPQGRIGAGEFWQGVIILLIISVLLGAIRAYGPASASLPMLLLSVVLVYPQVCVFAKRFHDAGKSGWWYLAVIGVYLLCTVVLGIILGVVLAAGQFSSGGTTPTFGSPEFTAYQRGMAQRLYLPATAIGAVIWLIISFFVAQLKPDPEENKYGMPPGSEPVL